MIILRRFLLAFLVAGASLPASSADGIAFLSNVKGEVAIDGTPRAPILAELARGQRLAVGRDSLAAVMYIASGKEYVLKGPAEYVIKDTEVSSSTGMPPVVRSTEWRTSSKVLGQVAQTSAASVRMRSMAPPKPDSGPRLVFPTQGSVATLQPTFLWRADGAQQGEFTLAVLGEEKPLHQAKASGDSYRLPAKLKPETEYAWTYAIAGQEIGTGKFRTLPMEEVRRVERQRPGEKAGFSDRLLFTLMLQEMGAVQEAQQSWVRLSQERADLPELSALAR